MAKKQLFIKANERKNGVVYKSLQETPVNSFDCFKETVMRSNYKKCSYIGMAAEIEKCST